MTAPLTPEREARIRARLSTMEEEWPDLAPLEDESVLLAEIDRLRAELERARKTAEEVSLASTLRIEALDHARAELATAEARGREAGLREAATIAQAAYLPAGQGLNVTETERGNLRAFGIARSILALIAAPPPPQGGSDVR